jgi:hypothetical protein
MYLQSMQSCCSIGEISSLPCLSKIGDDPYWTNEELNIVKKDFPRDVKEVITQARQQGLEMVIFSDVDSNKGGAAVARELRRLGHKVTRKIARQKACDDHNSKLSLYIWTVKAGSKRGKR